VVVVMLNSYIGLVSSGSKRSRLSSSHTHRELILSVNQLPAVRNTARCD
jgi:hypothetical protein